MSFYLENPENIGIQIKNTFDKKQDCVYHKKQPKKYKKTNPLHNVSSIPMASFVFLIFFYVSIQPSQKSVLFFYIVVLFLYSFVPTSCHRQINHSNPKLKIDLTSCVHPQTKFGFVERGNLFIYSHSSSKSVIPLYITS